MTRQQLTKAFAILLSTCFIISIALPLLLLPFGNERLLSEREQRRLAPKPALSFDLSLLTTYPQQFSNYFADHFALRDPILRVATAYKEKLLNRSLAEHVVIGRDGWRFMNLDGTLYDYIGHYQPDAQQLMRWQQGLEIKQRWLGELGIRYLLVPIPGKESAYPEQLPKRFDGQRSVSRLQAFQEHLAGSALADSVLDLSSLIKQQKQLKQQVPLYFKTDTHWNDDGAYLAYVATIAKLQSWFPALEAVTSDRLERQPHQKFGDIARASGLPTAKSETTEVMTVKNPCADRPDQILADFAKTAAFKQRPKKLPVLNGCATETVRAVVVHDSFGVYLRRFLNESFGEVVYMHSYDVFGMKAFLQEFKADVYIDFRAGRRFHNLLEIDPEILKRLQNSK